jgi:MerR family transcriptional regulator/heat shock protein HspR
MSSTIIDSLSAVTLELAARLVQMPPAQLRRYAVSGLVKPKRVEKDRCWYGPEELARLRKIRRLRQDLGLNPAAIEVVLRLTDQIELLHRRLDDSRNTNPARDGEQASPSSTVRGACSRVR